MQLPKYLVLASPDHLTYEFFSDGPNGTIKKVVYFQELDDNIYNLAFGDWNDAERRIDDLARSNNGDRGKVLSTVASIVIGFLRHYPEASVFAVGSTPSRTRLYQIGIQANWHEINNILNVKGHFEGIWYPFERNKNYESFLVRAK